MRAVAATEFRSPDFAVRTVTMDGSTKGTVWLGETRLAKIEFDSPLLAETFIDALYALASRIDAAPGDTT